MEFFSTKNISLFEIGAYNNYLLNFFQNIMRNTKTFQLNKGSFP